jgi:23S rRNA (uracil1939-C5)-methyltransferase
MTKPSNGSGKKSADEEFEVELIGMAHGGRSLGRHEGRTLFIPYTIPGEVVIARITQERGRIAFAEGVTLLDSSADRVYPRCPHFGPGRCGRCQWQHIDYGAQLLLKQDVLSDQLGRIGGFEDTIIEAVVQPVIPSPEQWGYNHIMTFHILENGALAMPADYGSADFPIEVCYILHPALFELFDQLDFEALTARSIQLRLGTDNQHMVILSIDDENAVPELLLDLPTSVNLLLPDHEPVNLVGDLYNRFVIKEHEFRVSAGCFLRANPYLLPALADTVLQLAAPTANDSVLDLYGGVGFFSAFTAPFVPKITLVESYPPAIFDARLNLAAFDSIDIVDGTVEEVLPELDHHSICIVDPPADGMSLPAMDALMAHRPEKLIYVSGDPAILARDAKRFSAQGYKLQHVQPLDFSPQTYYIDSVALFLI